MFTNMFKVTASLPKRVGCRFATKLAEKSANSAAPVESYRVENDVNGMTVVSIQPKVATISRVAAVFNAGSRFEEYESMGMNHLLRRSVGLASGGFSAVNVTRHLQQMGTRVRCSGTRETLAYIADFSYDMMDRAVELLSHATTRQMFYHWELSRSAKSLMTIDIQYLMRRDFDALTSELLHKAAYRDTLGNSLFADEHFLGKWSLETIENFLNNNFSANRCMLLGISVQHENLIKHASNFKIRPRKELKFSAPVFRGGELRKELPIDYAITSVVWEAPGFNKMKESIAASILADAIDNDIDLRIKWNNGSMELIKRVVNDPKINEHCSAHSYYASYSDSGMFGFTTVGAPFVFQDALCGLYRHFVMTGKNGVPSKDFEVAKKGFIVKLLMRSDCIDGITENAISQNAGGNRILSIEEIIDIAQTVTLDDVNKVAKEIFSSPNKAMSAVGDLSNMPYLSDLQC